jgi:methionine synthase II (cobalamin-independent)
MILILRGGVMKFEPKSSATIIGSFPHLEAKKACDLIFKSLEDIPTWPQLPRRSFFEEMNNQYSKNLPCFFVDEENKKSGFNTSKDMAGELERFYTKIIEDDVEYFGLDEKHGAGFACYIDELVERKRNAFIALKGQITGPLTLGLMTDSVDGKYALYKPEIFDAIVKNCVMNARWQIRKLKEFSDTVIIFFDEPSLSVIGSGFYSVDPALVSRAFSEIIQGIKNEGGLAGTHCCGNADWDGLIDPELDLDIINFDATDNIIVDKFINSKNLPSFLERGKSVAWGVVPTVKDKIAIATVENVKENYGAVVSLLAARGVKREIILNQSLITPSCGTGTLSVPHSEKVMSMLRELSGKA